MEVEGIARDITERKRLEKEILEASNREQQRIGHDLHDGVCQQLAGIAYRMDILADQLQEKHVSEAPEAERIGGLINEAITQTRSVARGLFPVHLEENGLMLTLEELAAKCHKFIQDKMRFYLRGARANPGECRRGPFILYRPGSGLKCRQTWKGEPREHRFKAQRRPLCVEHPGRRYGLPADERAFGRHGCANYVLPRQDDRRHFRLEKFAW